MIVKRIMNLKGINFWYLASGIALNLFWTMVIAMLFSALFLKQAPGGEGGLMAVLLMLLIFLGPFIIGWIVGNMAADLHGPTYGVYGSLGSAIVLLIAALPTGFTGIMLIIAAIAGGLNGGLLSLRGRLKD